MNQSDFDPDIVVATLVEAPSQKVSVGCTLAIIGAGLVGLLLLVAAVGVAIYSMNEARSNLQVTETTPPELRVEASQDIESSKAAVLQSTSELEHPEHDRIVAFIDSMQSVLDDTPNPRLQKMIDYDLLAKEVIRRADSLDRSAVLRIVLSNRLKQHTIGPTSFSSYELARIENEGLGKFRVYLNYPGGYEADEPHIWWLVDDGEIKLYDWTQLELGLRASTEDAILYDAPDSYSPGYARYAKLCRDYLASGEQGLSFFERKKLIKSLLTQCEQFDGPPALSPSVHLITARRWHHEGESERALALLQKIGEPNVVPGVYSLAGDIQLERQDYRAAAKSYQSYIELLGPTSRVQARLATCYRELGENELEREALVVLTRSITESRFHAVAQLIELNAEVQHDYWLSHIDQLPCRDAAYLYLIGRFNQEDYFADRFEQLHRHLQKTAPQSEAALLTKSKSDPTTENLVAVLKWIDKNSEDDSEGQRYNFWYELDEKRVVEVLKRSPDLEADFDSISEVNEYEGSISDEVMLAVCQWVLSSQPDNVQALYRQGTLQNRQLDFEAANKSLQKSLKAVPDSHEDASMMQSELLSAIYRSGDRAAAINMATDPELATQLLELMATADDYKDFDKLLKRLDTDSNEFKFQSVILQHHQGETDEALRALADLIKDNNGSEQRDYRVYSYRYKLLEFCEQQDDLIKAFTLEPSDEMLSLVSERLIQNFDWASCKDLLQSSASEDLELQRIQLSQRIDWEQGNYEQVVAQAEPVLEMAESELVDEAVERLVRAALRIGKPELAMEFAESAAELADLHELVALVALHNLDSQRAAIAMEQLNQYEKQSFYTDPDLKSVAWRDIARSKQMPPRQLYYYASDPPQFEVRMLFSKSQEFQLEELQAAFASAVGANVRIELIEQPGASPSSWVIHGESGRIYISEDSFDGVRAAKFCEVESLKKAIEAASFQVRLIGFSHAPTTAETDHEISVAAIECLANETFLAVERDLQWLTAADFVRFADQSAENQATASAQLFTSGKLEGDFFMPHEPVDNQQSVRNQEFLDELIAAIKQFENSADVDKRLVIQFALQDGIPEKTEATVNRILRTGYGSITLNATILRDAKFDRSICEGDTVSLYLYQIDGFELKTSDQVLKRNRKQD